MWFYWAKIDQKNYIALDNPTDQLLEVEINQESYILSPYQTLSISLGKGRHRLRVLQKDSTYKSYEILRGDEVRALINPTLSSYVIYKRYYGKAVNRDSLIRSHQSRVDSILYFGELYTTDSLYIKGFYLNVDQSYPVITKSMDTISAIPKIFRKDQFKQFYRQNYQ